MSTAMEIDQRLESDLGGDVILRLGGGVFVRSIVVGVDIGLVVLGVVKLWTWSAVASLVGMRWAYLHDLAVDRRFERAIVI